MIVALSDHIIEAFKALGGIRSIQEIEAWVTDRYGSSWVHSSFGTTMADMVSESLGGNTTSMVPAEKRVLRRVSRGMYSLVSQITRPDNADTVIPLPGSVSSALDIFVKGSPAPFANLGEKEWKNQLRNHVPKKEVLDNERGIVLSFGYNGRGDLDNLCEPVLSVVVNEKGWFGGRRSNIEWWLASKRAGPSGCSVIVSNEDSPQTFTGLEVFSGIYQGPIPRRATNEPMLDWVRSTYEKSPIEGDLSVELVFNGWEVNLGDVATGPIKSCIDCLQPVIGGPMGNPDDQKVSRLHVSREISDQRSVLIRIRV